MNRFTRISVLALAATGLGACSYIQPPALAIARDEASDPFFTFSADQLYDEVSGAGTPTGGTTTRPATVDAERVAEVLTGEIRPKLLEQVLADREIRPTDEDRALVQQAASQQQSAMGPEEEAYQVNVAALARVLAADFFSRPGNDVGEYARRFYEQRKSSFAEPAQTCLHVITVDAGDGRTEPTDEQYAATQPQAQALRARLDNEPFEAVFSATSPSTQEIPGGDLGCQPDAQLPSELVQAMAAVPVGSISEPLQWRAGWAIVRIDDRRPERTPPFEEVQAQAVAATRQTFGQQFVSEVLIRAFRSFRVTVDPRFGRWDPEQGQVLPPGGASTPTTPTTSTTLPPLDEGTGTTPAPGAPAGTSTTTAAPAETTATTSAG